MSNKLFTVARRSDKAIDNRTVEFVLSTASEDRGGDTIAQDGWRLENYKKNPVILWGHDQRIPPIGRGHNVRVSKGILKADIEFATAEQHPFAETVYQLVRGGFVNAGSVGFIPLKWNWNEETRGIDFFEQELIEYSVVGVPMNPEALSQAKAFGLDGDAIERAFGAFNQIAELATKAAEFRAELIASANPKHVPTGKFKRRATVATLSSL